MKKVFVSIALLLGIGLVLHGVVAAQGKAGSPDVAANGAALWEYVKSADYKTWKMWPGTSAFYQGQLPHGAWLTTYVNEPAFNAIEAKAGSLPDGSIVVMENYSSAKELTALTMIYKVKGYNPEGDDWFWARYLPDGKIDSEGKVSLCMVCHGMAKNNDYIMRHLLK